MIKHACPVPSERRRCFGGEGCLALETTGLRPALGTSESPRRIGPLPPASGEHLACLPEGDAEAQRGPGQLPEATQLTPDLGSGVSAPSFLREEHCPEDIRLPHLA